uniref:Uncharacterized protein n=1 Tax=Romanomermis culicivorax TaxID=13658 RepID=A0A915JD74_ROMCU
MPGLKTIGDKMLGFKTVGLKMLGDKTMGLRTKGLRTAGRIFLHWSKTMRREKKIYVEYQEDSNAVTCKILKPFPVRVTTRASHRVPELAGPVRGVPTYNMCCSPSMLGKEKCSMPASKFFLCLGFCSLTKYLFAEHCLAKSLLGAVLAEHRRALGMLVEQRAQRMWAPDIGYHGHYQGRPAIFGYYYSEC